ncbi:IS5 family transposase [Actinomadura luteofluorescens]
MAAVAPGRAGRAGWLRDGRLEQRDRGRRRRPGGKGGTLTGPNPVDRAKRGSKLHVLSDARGLPLVVGVSAANVVDIEAFKPLFMAVPPIRSRRGPRRRRPAEARADKAYDSADLRHWLRRRGVIPRIARRGIDSSERLGRYRWKIERTLAWLLGYRRLTIRYERHGHLFAALLTLAAALICYKKLAQITT